MIKRTESSQHRKTEGDSGKAADIFNMEAGFLEDDGTVPLAVKETALQLKVVQVVHFN